MAQLAPFHFAFPVDDLDAARHFYGTVLGCPEGRSDSDWIDFNLYGHQIVAHRVARRDAVAGHNPVDGHDVPVPHFGVVLPPDEWRALAARLQDQGVRIALLVDLVRQNRDGRKDGAHFVMVLLMVSR